MHVKSLYPPVPEIPTANFHTILFDPSLPDHVLHIEESTGRQRTRLEFIERVKIGAAALGAQTEQGGLGLRAEDGEIVGILSDNCLDYPVLFHSLIYAALPMALVWSYSTPYELQHLFQQSGITRLFVSPDLLPVALQAVPKIGLSSDHLYILDGEVAGYDDFGAMIERVRTNNVALTHPRPVEKDTLAYLIHSSGTSGLPKSVMVSHGNLCFIHAQLEIVMKGSIKQIKQYVQHQGNPPVWLAFMPFSHGYGCSMAMTIGLMIPITHVIISRWNLDQVLDAAVKYRVQQLSLNPTLIYELVQSDKLSKTDLSFVTTVTSGGASLPPSLMKRMDEAIGHRVHFSLNYAATEMVCGAVNLPAPGAIPGINPPKNSTGILWPGMEARTLRSDGSDADADEIGDLYVRGPNLALGYYRDEESTKDAFLKDGWYKTGDRFRIDVHGNFYFEDRVKDTLRFGGRAVSPTELENVLFAHPDKLIVDASVAGVPWEGPLGEPVPRAWIVLSSAGSDVGAKEASEILDSWLKEVLGEHKWLRGGIEVVDQIPKSLTGKPLRRVLQERYAEARK